MKINFALFGLLFKLSKVLKILMFGGTATIYTAAYGWEFALLLMVCITIHELGHLWAMKRENFPIKGFYMIPFVGAMILPERNFKTYAEQAFIAAMGPAAGALISLTAAGVYVVTKQGVWAEIAIFNTILNMFNMLPIHPLDGGRIAKSIIFSAALPKLKTFFLVLTAMMLLAILAMLINSLAGSNGIWQTIARTTNLLLWVFIIVAALYELSHEKENHTCTPMTKKGVMWACGGYAAIITAFVAATAVTWGHPLVPAFVKGVIF